MTQIDRERVARALDFDDAVDVDEALRRFRRRDVRHVPHAPRFALGAATAVLAALVAIVVFGVSPLRAVAFAAIDRIVVSRYAASEVPPQAILRRFAVSTFVRRPVRAPCTGSLADASARAGFTVRIPHAMESSVLAGPCPIAIDPGWIASWRLDAGVARRHRLALPGALSGAQLRVDTGVVAQMRIGGTVRGSAPGSTVLVLDEARNPIVESRGASLSAILRWLRSEPQITPSESAIVTRFAAAPEELPLPLPAALSRTVPVAGRAALGYETPLRTVSALIWTDRGLTFVLYGNRPLHELVAVAESGG